MAIVDIDPMFSLHGVTTTIELYDELEALFLDHLLDHLDNLAQLASLGVVSDDETYKRLAAHPRYRPVLKNAYESASPIVRLLHKETHLLLSLFVVLCMSPDNDKPAVYRLLRTLVPYIGRSEPTPPPPAS
jgi:hypothetical protein